MGNDRHVLNPIEITGHMQKKVMHLTIGSVAFLMIVTGALYLYVATQEIAEANEIFVEHEDEPINGALIETVFFATVGGAYIPVGLWAISSRHSSKSPYWLAIIGSGALIILYVLSRTVDMPLVGMQGKLSKS